MNQAKLASPNEISETVLLRFIQPNRLVVAIENYLIINNLWLLEVVRAIWGESQEMKNVLFKRSHL